MPNYKKNNSAAPDSLKMRGPWNCRCFTLKLIYFGRKTPKLLVEGGTVKISKPPQQDALIFQIACLKPFVN